MKGLLLKDLLSMKNSIGILGAFIIFYAVLGFFGENSSMVTGVLMVILMMLPSNTLAYDEFYHWDRYVLTMPVSRKMVVQSKYVLCALLAIFVLAVSTVYNTVVVGKLLDGFMNSLFVTLVALLISMLMLPCLLKWGAQRGRLVILMICGLIGALIAMAILMVSGASGSIQDEASVMMALSDAWLTVIMALVVLVAAVVSYWISCRLYAHKEF